MVRKINHEQLKQVIRILYENPDRDGKKIPGMCYGSFGIGKSQSIKQASKMLAFLRKKKFVEWNLLTYEQKLDIIENNKYKELFIYFDIRLAQFDSVDIRGLPDYSKLRRWVEWRYPFFVEILQHPDSDGILFFDEINLATDMTLKSCYQILHDKVISDVKINYNWLILAAGNLETDRSNVQDMVPPLKDRLCEFELIPPSNREWIKWALSVGINAKIIAYHTWKGDMLRKINYKDGQKFTSERGWQRIDAIMNLPISDIELIAGTLIGEGVAVEFVDFLKLQDKVNLDEIVRNPEKIRTVTDVGQKYFVISGLSEKYAQDGMTFEQLFAISVVLEDSKSGDFTALLWRFCSKLSKAKFRKDFTTKELKHSLRDKFYRYLTD